MQPTSDSQFPHHGGDLGFATARYGTPPTGWLDLSTGISPEPYPAPTVEAATLATLPQSSAHAALIEAARSAYRLPAATKLLAAPGSEIALRLLPFVAPPGPVAIVGPTYRSHSDAWLAADRPIVKIAATSDTPPETAVLVVVNPNNPDGRTIAGSDLAEIAERMAAKGGLLIVDEAFADLDPEISLAPLLDSVPAVVLRSFGKFYGLPGLRLGFVAGPASITDRLAQLLGDWPVSTAALAIGRAALTDREWQNSTRRTLAERGKRLRSLLLRHGLRIAGGTDLFVLVEHSAADAIHAQLAEAGIWTRAFADRPEWLRIGLPRDNADFARLDAALAAAMTPIRSRSTG
jgi:cobalamin biosynthetic protein CobC